MEAVINSCPAFAISQEYYEHPDFTLAGQAALTLAALPLFIWMGEILFRTRLSDEMFEGLAPWLGWLPGRLMHVNVLACGIFGTVSGSSTATR